MKTSVLATIVLALGVVVAGADEPRDVSELMTKGKLEADLGNNRKAVEFFEAVAASPTASDAQRWEALVRLGVVRRAAGDHRGSVDAFNQVWRDRSNDREALLFLVQAVGGVAPGRQRWEEIWTKVTLTSDTGDPSRSALRVNWPGAPEGGGRPRYTGHPISLDLMDGDLQDIFRLFADITGLNVVVNPGVRGQVTLKVTKLPWDEVLGLMLAPNGLGYRLEGNVLRIARFEQLGETRRYSGKPTSVWFKGETLAEVFDHFARLSGQRIFVDPAVGGKMHLKLDNVPWDQALDIVVRVNGLEWTREGNVIRILPPGRRRAG